MNQRGSLPMDLTGRRIGRLTVVRLLPKDGKHRKWECQCDCGRAHVTRAVNLQRGDTTSCGCKSAEIRERFKTAFLKHGQRRGRKPGEKESPTYASWYAMKSRCAARVGGASRWYAANGIEVCERWKSFENFLADMGPRPPDMTLDRINVEKGYLPSNCRWATRREQRLNRRDTKLYTYAGKTLCLTDWIREISGGEKQKLTRSAKSVNLK